MKKTVFVFGSAVVLLLAACSKENATGLVLQSHDANRMMDTMHADACYYEQNGNNDNEQ